MPIKRSFQQKFERRKKSFIRLRKEKFKVNVSKSRFSKPEKIYLEYIVSCEDIEHRPEMIVAILKIV